MALVGFEQMPGFEFDGLEQTNKSLWIAHNASPWASAAACTGRMHRLHRRGRVEQQHIQPPATHQRFGMNCQACREPRLVGTGPRAHHQQIHIIAALSVIGPRAEKQHPAIVARLRDERSLQ